MHSANFTAFSLAEFALPVPLAVPELVAVPELLAVSVAEGSFEQPAPSKLIRVSMARMLQCSSHVCSSVCGWR
jgi:hypothetical protein